jgi:hypothetical protein
MYTIKNLTPVEPAEVSNEIAFEGVPLNGQPDGKNLLGRQVSLLDMETHLARNTGSGEVAGPLERTIDAKVLAETERAEDAEGDLAGAITDEQSRAKGIEGTLEALETTDKTNLVAAVNEVNSAATDKIDKACIPLDGDDKHELVNDIDFTTDGTTGKVVVTKYLSDVDDNTTRDVEATIPDATDEHDGLMSKEQAAALASAYQKPADGIPDTDLTEAVQSSLTLADTALQTVAVEVDGGITGDDTTGSPLDLSTEVKEDLTNLAYLPVIPETDGKYKLVVTGGAAAWEEI